MNREEKLTRMADYLDGLLDDCEAAAVEREIAAEPRLLAEAARLRALIYRPYQVPPPAAGMEERILRRAAGPPLRRLLRYAAVFAAGVLATLVFRSAPSETPAPEVEGPRAETPAPPALVWNRRIR